MTTPFAKRAVLLALAVVFVLSFGQASAAAPFNDWSVPSAPYSIAVQSTDTVWVTLPAQNAVSRVRVSPQNVATTTLFPIPTANADPYGIAFAGNSVWFTERLGNKIARLDPVSGVINEFPIQRANAQPVGIAVQPGTPDRIWFAERNANIIARLTVTSTVSFDFREFPLPAAWGNALPEGVAVGEEGRVWFTAPGANRLGLLRPTVAPPDDFYPIGTGAGSKPWAVAVVPGEQGYPWLTERQGHRIGVYMPQTFSDVRWFTPPTSASDPYDIALIGETVGFVERAASRVSLLDSRTGAIKERRAPGSAPTSLDFDASGCAWIAENGLSKVARWCPPYFNSPLYLPLVQKR